MTAGQGRSDRAEMLQIIEGTAFRLWGTTTTTAIDQHFPISINQDNIQFYLAMLPLHPCAPNADAARVIMILK